MIDQQERPILRDHTQIEYYLPQSGIVAPATAIVALCCLFLGVAWYVSSGRALPFDTAVHARVRGAGNPTLTTLLHITPYLGTITVLIAPITSLWLLNERRRAAAMVFLASVVGIGIFNICLKGVFQRTRPEWTGRPATISGYMFPSTHTVLTIVTYGLLAYVLSRRLQRWQRGALGLATAALVALVGLGLVYLNTHYFTDVLGGLLIGGAWLIGSCTILRILGTAPQASRILDERARIFLHGASEDRTFGNDVATAKREWE